ncbi:hypothetical protein Acr_09g0001570 [Actinidia rufa]|uniref:Uncharacterized protein n=1 Tax=Actinidia rufa TaxID=165716 RepID=A0A7J0F4U2_9ERIC|nr:hypothetical protein Acr_09g0001570 [Actinidia rufa]
MESQYDSSSSSTNKPPHFHSMLHSSSRLQSVAPPPLSLSTTKTSSDGDEAVATLELLPDTTTPPLSATYHDLMSQTLETKPWKPSNGFGAVGFSLSPSSHAWCSFLLPSPGTLSSLEAEYEYSFIDRYAAFSYPSLESLFWVYDLVFVYPNYELL